MTKTCQNCGTEFSVPEPEDDNFNMARYKRFCDPCVRILQEQNSEAGQAKRKREREFRATIPPAYGETIPDDPRLHERFRLEATKWDAAGRTGLGFVGQSGTGKTRCLMVCLVRAFEGGRSAAWISHNAFSKLVIAAFGSGPDGQQERAQQELRHLARVEVLLLDDVGKAPSTERCDAELEELIETRGTHHRPTLWSCNGSSVWLESRFGPDRGAALVRRLAEFSTVVKA